MKDEFEKYIRENRSEMDLEEPDRDFLWQGVGAGTSSRGFRKQLRWWQLTAAVLALLVLAESGYLLFGRDRNSGEVQIAATKPEGDAETGKGAFETLEVSYQKEVEVLLQEVREKKANPADYERLSAELGYLDRVEEDFKEDIPLVNDRERIAEILVDTYEKKIRLLERMLLEMEREEQQHRRQEVEVRHL